MDAAELTRVAVGASAVVAAYMTAWYAVSLLLRRNDLADLAWGPGFVCIAAFVVLRRPPDARLLLVAALVSLWAVRLAWHVGSRISGTSEDFRYAKWRAEWGRWFYLRTYLQVFVLQGLFMLVVSAPVLVTGASRGGPLGLFDLLGGAIWLAGLAFEAVGDAQLTRFKRDPANRGRIMREGLWAWTRHPNYFGESLAWWGLGVVALAVPGGWLAAVGPATITFLLVKVSGIPMLEAKHAGEPAFEEYRRTTSAFVPLPPRRDR